MDKLQMEELDEEIRELNGLDEMTREEREELDRIEAEWRGINGRQNN